MNNEDTLKEALKILDRQGEKPKKFKLTENERRGYFEVVDSPMVSDGDYSRCTGYFRSINREEAEWVRDTLNERFRNRGR